MRRVTRRRPDERGAMVVFLAIFSVVMIGMAALVIDVGSLLDEKRQLQNGADAGALAVAHSCAAGACNPALAGALANSNSKDGESTVELPKDVDLTSKHPSCANSDKCVTVTTRTRAGGSSILPYEFGQILSGVKGKGLTASATARWAPLGRAVVLRLAISACDVNLLGISTTPQTIMFHSTAQGCDTNSGQDASGAFGWLDDDNPPSGLKCELTATAGQTASGDPGASGPTECLNPYFPTDILLPVFDDKVGVVKKGQKVEYLIKGFARFHLVGYKFPGAASMTPPCSGNNSCIRGYFVRYVTSIEATVFGVGADFGVSTVNLVS
jgi:hypothetical protein